MVLYLSLALFACNSELGMEVCQDEGCAGGSVCVVERAFNAQGRRIDDVGTCRPAPDPCAGYLFDEEGSCLLSPGFPNRDAEGYSIPEDSPEDQACYDALLAMCPETFVTPYVVAVRCEYTRYEGPLVDAPLLTCSSDGAPSP